ncbi:hypothetical protein X777_14509 [Ooceraea biroi]|uniref:Uncharacterized protein n=1 Tax=Ooceraea biroi TaxID=2015173 RepID=A0A026VVW4_OOCBI|nr:hypothetical protein X777_14509 [Ooceraea biroi]
MPDKLSGQLLDHDRDTVSPIIQSTIKFIYRRDRRNTRAGIDATLFLRCAFVQHKSQRETSRE